MRIQFFLAAAALSLLAACAGPIAQRPAAGSAARTVPVQILAFNDFHGNLEPPKLAIEAPAPGGATVRVPAGGAAYFAAALEALRTGHPNTITVSAGDMIGASPLVSALFLDEPTIAAMNLAKVDINALGNHEYDKGRDELLRMKAGGCAVFTTRTPCRLEPFAGAKFDMLAANSITESGATLFPPYSLRTFGTGTGQVKIGFIGLTLKAIPTLVTPAGIAGMRFADEAETANALVPLLRAKGADAIVVVIHEGAKTSVGYDDKSCEGLSGDLLPILARLDPAIDVVASGHTHNAYVCDYGKIDPTRPFLLTSAGKYGTLLTDIALEIDPVAHKVIAKRANNRIVQGEGFTDAKGPAAVTNLYPRYVPEPKVAALVARYAEAAAKDVTRVVAKLAGPATKEVNGSGEMVLGDLIADSQLAATRGPGKGDADIAFMNPGGVRTAILPAADGSVTFGQLFAAQPFGNTLAIKTFTGRELKAILEQQFSGRNSPESPLLLQPSANVRIRFDRGKPAGARILEVLVDGRPLADTAEIRVTMNSFLASGGDGFTLFAEGRDTFVGPVDLDALEAHLRAAPQPAPLPATGRLQDETYKG